MCKCWSRKACRHLISASQRDAETSVFLLLLCGWIRIIPKGIFWCLPLLTSSVQLPLKCRNTPGSPHTESTQSVWQPLHGQTGTFTNASSSSLRGQSEVELGCPQKQQVLQMPLDLRVTSMISHFRHMLVCQQHLPSAKRCWLPVLRSLFKFGQSL